MYEKYLNDNNPVITFNIKDFGSIDIELFPELAPNTVANFVDLATNNYFAGSTFHRVIKGFMIQGGGGSTPLRPISGEFNSNGFPNDLKHVKGVISMARTMNPNSATSQFFLMHETSPHLDGEYAGFGIAKTNLDLIDRIANERTNAYDAPLNEVVIEGTTVNLNGYVLPQVKYL